jgi:LDH2 family malate/lactate/ureidoglycolate dehydrogenase
MKTEEQRFGYHQLCSAVTRAIVVAGVAADLAEIEAAVMVEADLQGVPSHGVRMLPGLLRGLADGRVNTRPDIRLLHEFSAVCRLDGDNGPGRYVARQAMNHAMERASRFGIGVCLAGRTTHWGRAHYYAAWAARQGLIGICMTNGMPCMAIFGATTRVIGNNPLAIAIPRGEEEDPVVLDMAMSQAAVGKVATWLREKREIPEHWGLDDQGRPSSDAKAILGGAVLPFGGHKGAGLALMIELLTAGLAGGLFGNEIMAGDRSGLDPESSKLFVAIDPQAFGDREILATRVGEYLAYLGEVTVGAESLTWPGRRGYGARTVNLARGVPLHREIVAELRAAGVVLPA